MARYTVSQLRKIPTSYYSILDSDLMLLTIGTDTYNLSSVRVTLQEFGDYLTTTYASRNDLTVTGNISGQRGLSASHGWQATHTIKFEDLPTADTGLATGDLFTQTKAEILGTGSDTTKILCVK